MAATMLLHIARFRIRFGLRDVLKVLALTVFISSKVQLPYKQHRRFADRCSSFSFLLRFTPPQHSYAPQRILTRQSLAVSIDTFELPFFGYIHVIWKGSYAWRGRI